MFKKYFFTPTSNFRTPDFIPKIQYLNGFVRKIKKLAIGS